MEQEIEDGGETGGDGGETGGGDGGEKKNHWGAVQLTDCVRRLRRRRRRECV